MVENVGAVGDSGVAQHAHSDDLLLQVQGLVFSGDDVGELLIAGGDVAGAGDIEEQRREHVFQAVLIAPVDGFIPGVFDLLELRISGEAVDVTGPGQGQRRWSGPGPTQSRGEEQQKSKRKIRFMSVPKLPDTMISLGRKEDGSGDGSGD